MRSMVEGGVDLRCRCVRGEPPPPPLRGGPPPRAGEDLHYAIASPNISARTNRTGGDPCEIAASL